MRLPQHYRETIDTLFGRNCELEAQVRQLRRANAILALPRITEQQIIETERALRRILGEDECRSRL
jgi:hypothetical protein